MSVKLPAIPVYLLNVSYIILFFLASYITSLFIADVKFQHLIVLTGVVIIYWFIANAITGLYKRSKNMKQIQIKTVISFLIITIVTSLQQLMFFKIPFTATFTFFGISLLFLLLLHSVSFRPRFSTE
ncbi:hypothetical protein [Lentibacillus cibarius]|uniref:Uncharacterized protein n=1 Tax=Lentibacillus cibarius TaxID=2583219 RepID=A0A5S3QMI4_9BACI|nr:hypothetical protein [Lentibacillus cibarius]TMN23110.1 hypothetical protein FFL34_14195 [Lentibacillus cibarius]